MASASAFLSFMASYAIVLTPRKSILSSQASPQTDLISSFVVAAILSADYFFVKKRKYNVPELYDFSGIYGYKKGFNLAAVAALLISIPPNGTVFSLSQLKTVANINHISQSQE